ncbi:MAG: EAL domain-containing protein [Gammaproteobacteria bacterium]|nr:EAL domain-containing protein [Gammaproteobacteria bacterium]
MSVEYQNQVETRAGIYGFGMQAKSETVCFCSNAPASPIIGMAENLKINVIAEGVETEEQRLFLEKHGCHTYQGYLFSRPLPMTRFEKMLQTKIVTVS